MDIVLKRVYEKPSNADGVRILVDRIWPRGVSKEEAKLDHWLKQVAPSKELRQWFGHDPARWDEFRKRYYAEIKQSKKAALAVGQILEWAKAQRVTLLFGAKDHVHNNAYALKDYLENVRQG